MKFHRLNLAKIFALVTGCLFAAAFAQEAASAPAAAPAAPPSEPPTISGLYGQDIEEGGKFETIDLDEVVDDPDNKKSELQWTVTGNKALKVNIAGRKATVSVPDKHWYGQEELTFTVKDPSGASASEKAVFNVNAVNDPPSIKNFKGQKIKEGQKFAPVPLDELVEDIDNKPSEMVWDASLEVKGKSADGEPSVTIDPSRRLQIALPDTNWWGDFEIELNVTDAGGEQASAKALFSVAPVNDPPVLKKIPDQKVEEGNEFDEISLDDFVTDLDDEIETLKWSVSAGKELKPSIDPKSRTLKVKIPNEEWEGPAETFTVTVKDAAGASASTKVTYTVIGVNDPPELDEIPSQTIKEKESFKPINLAKLVKDVDDKFETLKWTFTGNKDLKVAFDKATGTATVNIPNKNWNGEENITFTVTDPRGGKAEQTATFTVESVNDVPVLKPIPDQTIKEKEKFSTIRLDAYVEDVETPKNEIQWDLAVKQLAHGNIDGELEAVMDANREVTIKIPSQLWNGAAEVTFTATDADGASVSHKSKFTVQSVNDAPKFVKKIADQTIKEKETFKEIQLDDYVEDADHAKEQLKWTVTGGKGLKFEIDKDRVARVVIPDTYWNGPAETFNITVTDPEGAKAVTTARFAVLSVNDPPVIKEIAGQTIREGGKFADVDLKQFVSDPDHAFNKLTVSLSGLKDLRVKNAAGVLQVTAPDAHWNGAETLTITVADPEGAKATAQVAFTVESVNDAPVISGLKGQKIKEKQAFQTVALDKISKDVDHAYKELTWEFDVKKLPGSSEGDLEVKVDANRVATVAIPDKYWHGAADITFKVTDPEGASASATERFEVESVNDLPVIKKIPDQTIKEKETFKPIALDDYVDDPDHSKEQLKWTVTGGKSLKMEIGKDRVANVKIPDVNWNGPTEKFKLTATDPEGGSASVEVSFTVVSVNDPPVLKEIKPQKIKEGGVFADIPLKDLVSDIDHKYNQLTWKFGGLDSIKTNFTPASGVLKLATPNKYWNGEEELSIVVTDPEGASAEAKVLLTVESVNNPPELKKIPDQTIKEKQAFKPIALASLASDPDHKFSELSWDFKVTGAPAPKKGVPSKGELSVETDKDGNAVVKIPDPQWFGKRTIVFTVTDPEGAKASQSAVFEVIEVNDPPVIKPIAAQTINEGGEFAAIDLNEYVSDPDNKNSELKWSIEGGKELKANIDPKSRKLTVKVPNKYWNCKVPEVFTLRVTDPAGASAQAKLSYMVNSVNNPPEIKAIKGQTIKEGGKFADVDLKQFVNDPDHEFNKLKIAVTGNKGLKVKVTGGVLSVTAPDQYWNGEETLTIAVTDPEGAVAKADVPFVVISVNNPPAFVKPLKGQTIKEKAAFAPVKLDELVKDPDHKNSELSWDVSLSAKGAAAPAKGKKGKAPAAAPCALQATLSDAHELKVVAPDKYWNGACDLTLTVTDPEGAKAVATVPYVVESVNDAPVIKPIAAQTIKEGGKFEVIDLNAVVSDPDHKNSELKWTVEGLKALKHTLDAKTGKLTVSVPDPQWHGAENLKLTVVDPEGAKAQAVVALTVQEVNDPPVISNKLKGQTVKEKSPFAPVKLDEFVSDPDDKNNQLVWTVSGGKELKATISPSRVLTVIAPSKYWHGGPETFTLTVKDPAGASASTKLDYTVLSVNDPPELRPISGQTVKENTPFKPIPLATLVSDPDHKKSELKWDVKVSGGAAAPAAKPAKGKKGKAAPAPAPSSQPDLTVTVGADGNATIKVPHSQWNGKRTITFTVTDPEGASASQSAVFEVLAVNDKPEIKPIPEQTIDEGGKFQPIKLTDYVSDPDNSFGQLKFDVAGLKGLKANISKDGVLTVSTPDKYWNGVETMKLTAMDPDSAKASVAVKFTVRSVNNPPEIDRKKLKGQKILEDTPFAEIKLDEFVHDPDHKAAQLKWTISGAKDLRFALSPSRVVKVTPPHGEWAGVENVLFTVVDPEGAKDTITLPFEVVAVNDAPVFKPIGDQKIKEGGKFSAIKLDSYVSDADNKNSELTFVFADRDLSKAAPAPAAKPAKNAKGKKGGKAAPAPKAKKYANGEVVGGIELEFDLDANRVLTVKTPNKHWNGKQDVWIHAIDPEGAMASTKVRFEVEAVNDKPEIARIPEQSIQEGGKFAPIALDDYVDDVDNEKSQLKWSLVRSAKGDPKNRLTIKLDAKRVMTVTTPDKHWNGHETVTLVVKDPAGAADSTKVSFRVLPVNDPPVFSKIPDQTVKGAEEFKPIDLTKYATDVDNPVRQLVWSVKGAAQLKVTIDYSGKATIEKPHRKWAGSETVTFVAKDPEGATGSVNVKFTVIAVNDPPEANNDYYTTDQDTELRVGADNGVLANDSDPDGDKPKNAAVVQQPRNGTLKFASDGSFVYTPKKGFNGEDYFTYNAIDKEKAVSKKPGRVDITIYQALGDIRATSSAAAKKDDKKDAKADKKDDKKKDAKKAPAKKAPAKKKGKKK